MGIENIKKLNLLSKNKFENLINLNLNKKILVTFHPVTLEKISGKQFKNLFSVIDDLK